MIKFAYNNLYLQRRKTWNFYVYGILFDIKGVKVLKGQSKVKGKHFQKKCN